MTLPITALTPADSAAAIALLDRAFAEDPCLAWVLQQTQPGYPARRRAYLGAYLRYHQDNALPLLGAWQAEQLLGLSCFTLPEPVADPASLSALGGRIAQACGVDRLARLEQLIDAFDQHLGDAPAARIEFLAVAPEAQGRGLGSALLQASLAYIENQGCMHIALESGEPRNLALYLRHGFQLSGGVQRDALHQFYLQRLC
jgi:GNAT superfamily N-acetyltransferase